MKSILIAFILLTTFSCNLQNNQEIDVIGNWQLKSYKKENLSEYVELYIDEKQYYVLNEYGLNFVVNYNITEDLLFHANDTVIYSDPKIELIDDNLIFNFPNSQRVIYEIIKKGITPNIYINDDELKECYYKSFFNRKDNWIKRHTSN